MTISSISDLGQHLRSRQITARTQLDLHQLADELSSGRKADISDALRGNFGELTHVERGLRISSIYISESQTAAHHLNAVQAILQSVQDNTERISVDTLAASTLGQSSTILTTVAPAEDALKSIISSINQKVAGRSAFSGAATDQPALASSEVILGELEVAVAGAVDAADMVAVVDAWFQDPAGGYETSGYLGSTEDAGEFLIGDGQRVSHSVSALDPAIRTVISGLALASLVSRGIGPVDEASISELGIAAGERIISGKNQITETRADIGIAEARIETVLTVHKAAETTLGIRQNDLLSADPFETATKLQAVETQLSNIFLVTSRLSRLSLSEFL